MRLLAAGLSSLLLLTPAAATLEPPASMLEEIEESLAVSDVAYREGDLKRGWEVTTQALRLAVAMEEELLRSPATATERLARAELLLELAKVAIGRPEQEVAEPFLQKSIELYRESTGQGAPEVADALLTLADLRFREGRPNAWRKLVDEALAIRVRAYGEHHPAVADVWSLLGTEAEAGGDLVGAETYFRRAVAALEVSGSPTAEGLGLAYLELARVLTAKGEEAEAKRLTERGQGILKTNGR